MLHPIPKYIFIYLLFSFLGWLNEIIIFNKKQYDKVIQKIFNINIPILQIYGLIGIILFLIYDYFPSESITFKIIVATLLIVFAECYIGRLSYQYFGYQTWRYKDQYYPTCDGYVSGVVATLALLLISIFFVFDVPNLIIHNQIYK